MLGLVLVSTVHGENSHGDDKARWVRVVERADFESLLADAAELPPWPAIRSGSAAHPEDDSRDSQWREMAEKILHQLGDFRGTLRDRSSETLEPVLHSLLALRRGTGSATGYVNLVIADAINRSIIAELAYRLVDDHTFVISAELLVSLRDYEISVHSLVEMTNVETGSSIAVEDILESADPQNTMARLIEASTGDLEMAFSPVDGFERTGVIGFLRDPDVGKLLPRLWVTDRRLHVAIPMLATYAAASPDRPLAADIQAIGDMVSLISEEDLGSAISRATPMAVYDVAGLIRTVLDGRIELFVGLSGL